MKFGALQNLKDRFFSRGGGAIESFTLSAYGKLPIYKDYILWECLNDGAEDFKQWLDVAFGKTWEDFDGKSARLRGPCRALILLPDGKYAVAASMWPSADEGNMRKFPFALFTTFSRGDVVGRGLRGALDALAPVWLSLEREYEKIRQLGSIDELYAYLQRTDPSVQPPEPAPEQNLSLEQWHEALCPGRGRAFRRWIDHELNQVISAYRGFPEQGESLAVRLPLAGRLDIPTQAAIWESVFKQNLKKIPVFPSVVIEKGEDDEPGAITLVWREWLVDDARLFADKIRDYEFVEMLIPDKLAGDGADGELEDDLEIEAWIASFGKVKA